MTIQEQLIDKSKEAFILAIEIYNKPSIKYRLEGFSFFICNAWELMLKAHMIKKFGEESIYFPDKPNRTITENIGAFPDRYNNAVCDGKPKQCKNIPSEIYELMEYVTSDL